MVGRASPDAVKDSSDPTVAETWEIKLAREAAFPRYLLEMGIGERSIEGAEAGREKDKNEARG